MDNNYTIKAAARLTGVSEVVIRAWETRYNAIEPERTATKRRLYSEEDLNKLSLLGKLTQMGHRIGSIANLPLEDLKNMMSKDPLFSEVLNVDTRELPYLRILNQCIDCIRTYDSKNLERHLFEASVEYSNPILIDKIIIPLMEKVGEYWHDGIFRVSHEHLTSAVVRKFLSNLSDGYNISENAPSIVVTTPQGQYHEVGALIGASYAASKGWRVIYLGPSLPGEEIANVVSETKSKALFLSLVYPFDDPSLENEMLKLREGLNNGTILIVSGNAVDAYKTIFEKVKAKIVYDSESYKKILSTIRNGELNNE